MKQIIAVGLLSLSAQVAAASAATIKVLVPGSVIHAVEGIAFGNDGKLYGTSIHAQAVYRIDVQTGHVEIAVPSPDGESDDVAVGPKGTPAADVIAWTAQTTGEIRMLKPGGRPETILRNAPRVNPIAFNAQGRLFTAQVGAGEDTLWELDVTGLKPPRVVLKGKGRLNGFGFGSDGLLYAPRFGTDQLVAIDVNAQTQTVIAKGVGTSAAAKVDAAGDIISVDYINSDVWRTNPKTGETRKLAHLPNDVPDNLAIAKDGTIYIASVADSRILAMDPVTAHVRTVVDGRFTIALGVGMTTLNGQETLIVADPFGYRYVDPETGQVTRPPWAANRGASSAVAASDTLIAYSYSQFNRVKVIDRRTDQLIAETAAIKAPRGVAITSTGEVLVADADGNRIVRLVGKEVTDVTANLKQPVGLILEDDDTALISEFTGSISRVNLRTGARTELADGLRGPTALARMADGRIAVVEPEAGTVTAVDLKTNRRTVLADRLKLSMAEFHLPHDTNGGIAVGRDGAIYVTCPGDNTVMKITP